MKKIIIVTVFIFSVLYLIAEQNEYYFRSRYTGRKQISALTMLVSIDDVKDGYIYAYANDEQLKQFYNQGFTCEILPHPGTLYKPVMTDEYRNVETWQNYPTYDAYVALMYQFQTDYPDLCQVESLGSSVNGREILIAKISDNVQTDETEPEFLYVSSMHGDETTGYILLLDLMEYLLQNYNVIPRVTNLVDNMEIWISPLQNPDGTYNGGNNTVFNSIRFNGNSIDLNRNFPDPQYGDHPDGNDWQPETILMMDFAAAHHIAMGANYHGGAELVNYPWDCWLRIHPDDDWYIYTSTLYAATAQANSPAGYMTDENNGITNGFAWYECHGGRQDYMNYFQYTREVTIEISHTKTLPENQLLNYWEYNREAMLLYLEECRYGVHGIVTNQSGAPLQAKIEVVDHDTDHSQVYSDPDLGDYHRLLAEGTYDLEVSAFGYLPEHYTGLTVIAGATIDLDFSLESAPLYNVSGQVEDSSNHHPVGNALIEFVDTPLDPVYTCPLGSYQINDVPEGTYQVEITTENYFVLYAEIEVDANNTIHDFSLLPCSTEDFESGDFSNYEWQFSGSANWNVESSVVYEGSYSAVSGTITHNQESTLYLDYDTPTDSKINFFLKVYSESGYDFLKFYIDNELIQSWSGYVDWQDYEYDVTIGSHQFKWQYTKDGSMSVGSDCAWLDFISFPYSGMNAPALPVAPSAILKGNYPNPFNPETTISFTITNSNESTRIEVYNLKGQKVKMLVNEILPTGQHEAVWNGTDDNGKAVSSGVYFYQMKSGNYQKTKKMILLK